MERQRSFSSGVFDLPNHRIGRIDSFTSTVLSLCMAWSSPTSTSLICIRNILVPEPSSTGKITTIFLFQPIVILTGGLAKQQQRNCLKASADGKQSSHLGGSVLAANWSTTSGKITPNVLCAMLLQKQCPTSYTVNIPGPSSSQNQEPKKLWNQNSQRLKQKRLLLSLSLTLQPSIAATFQSGRRCTHLTTRRLFRLNRKLAGTIWCWDDGHPGGNWFNPITSSPY